MENKPLYHKIVVQQDGVQKEGPEHCIFVSYEVHENGEPDILISLQFAANKDEVIKLLHDQPHTIIENNYYYSDINWFINNTPADSEQNRVFKKIKQDIIDFIKSQLPLPQ